MISDGGFGDILAQAFDEAERSLRQAAENKLSADCTVLAARALAMALVDRCGISYRDAWDELCHVPNEMLWHLGTSQGWTILADHLARDMGMVNAPLFIPTIH